MQLNVIELNEFKHVCRSRRNLWN